MSTLESTISMLRVMPEADVRIIFEMTKKLFDDKVSPFAPVSKQQILQDVDASAAQIEQGKTIRASDAIQSLRTKYGL
ncbi:MAG: hypothetical protein IKH30_15740 [Clostridia bacterium]|nr:hypothetical protein [Clostridia bacterium]